ncbi:MAG: hypothetical protein RLZZ517_470 [Candidatus Parcubacteria bacterium]|jgi:Zn-dependent protease
MTAITIFSIIVLVFSVVVHEVSHGYIAYRFGDLTAKYQERLTFNPLKHIDPIGSIILPFIMSLLPGGLILGWAKPVPINPYNFKNRKLGEFATAFAGPLSNIFIASIFIVLVRLSGNLGLSSTFIELSLVVILINTVLACFNLMPVPPLDGYRIVALLLPQHLADRFEYFSQRFGLLIVLFFVLFLWDPIFMGVISVVELLVGIKIL